MRLLFSTLVALLTCHLAIGQTGTVAGKMIEQESGFEVIGGNVAVQGAEGVGAVSDLDGNYQLKLDPGTYTLEFSYIGFTTQTITDVVVNAGEVTNLDIQLYEGGI